MNAFEALLNLSDAEKAAKGVEYTPAEIAQQPQTWARAVDVLRARRSDIAQFMADAGLSGNGDTTLMLTGAGTSEFVGNAIVHALRSRLKREVQSIPTTHLVTHAAPMFVPGRPYVLLSFARSGNSPESVATYNAVQRACPGIRQLVITCNPNGALARAARSDDRALCIEMPEETNDESLVMTSAFSTMAFAAIGLCFLDDLDALRTIAGQLGAAANRIIHTCGDLLSDFAGRDFVRACFLGSNALFGAMQECHLKMLEMTEGRVAARFDSFLGLRHGPQVFVNDACIVVAALSSDPRIRRYEMDMLRELKTKEQGCGTLVICDRATDEIRAVCTSAIELFPDGVPVHDDFRVMTDVVAGQILGVFTSMKVGLKPDNPSAGGTINRVVQGVVIYD